MKRGTEPRVTSATNELGQESTPGWVLADTGTFYIVSPCQPKTHVLVIEPGTHLQRLQKPMSESL